MGVFIQKYQHLCLSACTESMVAALVGTKYDTQLDLPALQAIGSYFYQVRKNIISLKVNLPDWILGYKLIKCPEE